MARPASHSASDRFAALSIRDLLDARDAYHVHLAALEHVVATAIGRYRIRTHDPDARSPEAQPVARGSGDERTLSNTVVKAWSWPCVLVFVDHWFRPEEISSKIDEIVPPRLHLPDGRVVPTCVLATERDDAAPSEIRELSFSSGLMGGGYPVMTDVQGQERVGSVACLVSDGDRVFALTNRHVAGERGRPVSTVLQGRGVRVGTSSGRRLGKLPLGNVYTGWNSPRTFCDLDAGLIELDDMRQWTAQVFGLGEIGEPLDLNPETMTLGLIGLPVRAFGAASGAMQGEIQALFFRYRSIGGFDYVADFLIGPRAGGRPLPTRRGDSGTLWCVDDRPTRRGNGRREGGGEAPPSRPRPIALQWGGQRWQSGTPDRPIQFALASNLASICRLLEVEVVRGWNVGVSTYWGKVGHYTIGARACGVLHEPKLSKLMKLNLARIATSDQQILDGELPMNNDDDFIALADVPDLWWRSHRKLDEANHFADMDQEGKDGFAGRTLLQLWEDRDTRTPEVWTRFYDSVGVQEDKHRGALPFRVWQLYNAMKRFVEQRRIPEFVCAAGVLAHYVGDACQPLHVSFLHHGRPGHPEESEVHSVYETTMLERRRAALLGELDAALAGRQAEAAVSGGAEAADAVVRLMRSTIETLPPIDVIDAYNAEDGRERIPAMWDRLHERTVRCMAEGVVQLASLWESAWAEGGGPQIASDAIVEVEPGDLKTLYQDRAFVESAWLRKMAPLLL